MPTEKGPNTKRVEGLLVLLKEHNDKVAALIEEINEVLSGGMGIAAHMKEVEKAFDDAWSQRYAHGQRGHYVWRYAIDRPNIKRLLKTLGLEELKVRAVRYVATDDPFLVRQRHPFGLFVSGINGYAAEAPAATSCDLAPPSTCAHVPPCVSDVEHTRRRSAEMRA